MGLEATATSTREVLDERSLTVDVTLALAVSGHAPAVWQPLGSLD